MKHTIKHIYLLCALLCTMGAQAQLGRQFWFAAPEMAQHSKDMSLRLYLVTHTEAAEVTICMPANPNFAPQTFHIAPDGFQEVVLAADYTALRSLS